MFILSQSATICIIRCLLEYSAKYFGLGVHNNESVFQQLKCLNEGKTRVEVKFRSIFILLRRKKFQTFAITFTRAWYHSKAC